MACRVPVDVSRPARHSRAYEFRELSGSDVDAVYGLHQAILSYLDDPDVFHESPLDFFARHVGIDGHSFGTFYDGRLVAYALLRFPRDCPDNLGVDLRLAANELERVAHLELCAVHPNFRGQRLQLCLTLKRIRRAVEAGYYHIASTISPKNPVSLENHFSLGLRVRAIAEKYGGKLRFVLHRDMCLIQPETWEELLEIPLQDTEQIAELLSQGFAGHGLDKQGSIWKLRVGRVGDMEFDGWSPRAYRGDDEVPAMALRPA